MFIRNSGTRWVPKVRSQLKDYPSWQYPPQTIAGCRVVDQLTVMICGRDHLQKKSSTFCLVCLCMGFPYVYKITQLCLLKRRESPVPFEVISHACFMKISQTKGWGSFYPSQCLTPETRRVPNCSLITWSLLANWHVTLGQQSKVGICSNFSHPP